jgi:hypothetical protein
MMKYLKSYDQFESLIGFRISRGGNGREVSYESSYQSKPGAMMTMITLMISLSYLVFMTVRMYAVEDDSFISVDMKNLEDTQENKILDLGKNNFYPILQISTLAPIDEFGIRKEGSKSVELDVDYKQLNRYIEPMVLVKSRIGVRYVSRILKMQMCQDSPEYLELLKDVLKPSDFGKLMCPEKKSFDEFAKLEGFYRSKTDRVSMVVVISPCSRERGGDCFQEDRINQLLERIYFTFYQFEATAQLRNVNYPKANPVSFSLKFKQQFTISLNGWYDQNLFVRYNKVETQDNRYHPLRPETESMFYDLVRVSPPLTANNPMQN